MCELIPKKTLRCSSATTALLKVRPLALAFWVVAYKLQYNNLKIHQPITGHIYNKGSDFGLSLANRQSFCMVFHYVENAFLLSVLKIVPDRASLVPRPVRAIWVTRGGLEPSAIARCVSGEFSRQAWLVTSHPKSPRTTGNEAGTGLQFTHKNGLAARFLWLERSVHTQNLLWSSNSRLPLRSLLLRYTAENLQVALF